MALCVLGMHRSGTSAITGALQLLGVALGQRLIAGHAGINDLGYFEHIQIVDLHDALMRSMGTRWDDIRLMPDGWWRADDIAPFRARLRDVTERDFADAPLWALKDPRTCRLLPLWFEIFEALGASPRFLHMLRAPSEVATSLAKRDGFTRDKSACLWLLHNLEAERLTRGHLRAFMTYEALLAAPRETLARASEALGIAWPRPLDAAIDEIDKFLSPQLRHNVHEGNGAGAAPPGWQELAERAYYTLRAPSVGADNPAAVDPLQAELAARIDAFDPALADHLAQESRARARAEQSLRDIFASPSWVVTKPVRFLQRLVGR